MASNPSGTPPQPLAGPAAQVATMMASMRAHTQEQWKHYNIDTLTINTKSLAINCPLDNGRLPLDSLPPRSTPLSSPLLLLPPEIFHLILQHLSIQTITTFRQLSTHARSLISTNLLYASLFTHAPAALRAILTTSIGQHITLQQLHSSLTAPDCSVCGKFGDFFDLLTGSRVCHACFATSPRHPYRSDAHETHLFPIPVSLAKSTYGLSPGTLTLLPTVRSIPGIYGRERSNFRAKRVQLCLPSTAREYGIKQHGSARAMNDWVERKRVEFEARQRRKWERTDWANGGMIIGSSTPDFRDGDMGWDNPVRHMVVVRFPWVKRNGEVELGVVCERCREKAAGEEEGERRWNVRFSKEGLGEHLKACR